MIKRFMILWAKISSISISVLVIYAMINHLISFSVSWDILLYLSSAISLIPLFFIGWAKKKGKIIIIWGKILAILLSINLIFNLSGESLIYNLIAILLYFPIFYFSWVDWRKAKQERNKKEK